MTFRGDRDAFRRPQEAEFINRENASAQLVEVPNAEHLPWLDIPEFVVTTRERFLEERQPTVLEAPSENTRRASMGRAGVLRSGDPTEVPDVLRVRVRWMFEG